MLDQYVNKEDILLAQGPIVAKRLDQKSRELLTPPAQQFKLTDLSIGVASEIHVYSGENWITADHNIVLNARGNRPISSIGVSLAPKGGQKSRDSNGNLVQSSLPRSVANVVSKQTQSGFMPQTSFIKYD